MAIEGEDAAAVEIAVAVSSNSSTSKSNNNKNNSNLMQVLVNVPFWEYWTSPYSSHYRPYT